MRHALGQPPRPPQLAPQAAERRALVFLTNQPTFPALTIAALNKSRWQVELSLKWIQQHLRIKRVTTQIWCAVATIVKQELR